MYLICSLGDNPFISLLIRSRMALIVLTASNLFFTKYLSGRSDLQLWVTRHQVYSIESANPAPLYDMLEIPTNQYIDPLDGRNSDMLSVYAMGLALRRAVECTPRQAESLRCLNRLSRLFEPPVAAKETGPV